MGWIVRLAAAILVLAAGTSVAQQREHRLALVIGNADYNDARTREGEAARLKAGFLPNLKKPINDADDVQASLERRGFRVIPARNASLARMRGDIQFFGERLKALGPSSISFVYFSGHAVQADGSNWLIPVGVQVPMDRPLDTPERRAAMLREIAIPLSEILEQVRLSGAAANIIVLDACRDNPWEAGVSGSREGLAQAQFDQRGTLVQYATGANRQASDGSDDARNSPYARALKSALDEGGALSLVSLFDSVAGDVYRSTQGQQTPFTQSSAMPNDVCLDECPSDSRTEALAGATLFDCEGCPAIRRLGGGRFEMGSPVGERGRNQEAEGRGMRWVTVSPFFIGTFEVTAAEYGACVRARECDPPRTVQPDRHPVTDVTWHNAIQYVKWLSVKTGQRYRLPTEAEWEFAARGGTITAFASDGPAPTDCQSLRAQPQRDGARPTGLPGLCRASNHRDRSSPPADYRNETCDDGVSWGTSEVGSYEPNRFCLFDMQGNVWEWVQDCYSAEYRDVPLDGRAYLADDANCTRRVDRGGSFDSSWVALRSADRGRADPNRPEANIGFRVARDP